LQFSRNYKLQSLENENISISPGLSAILGKNKAIRKFKRSQNKNDSEEKRLKIKIKKNRSFSKKNRYLHNTPEEPY
jgi:hypothetical protein